MKIQEIETLIQQFRHLAQGRMDFRKYAYYAITHHSTAIEGSTLTENQVVDLLEYGKTVPDKPFAHHLMAYDHFRALEYVVNQADGQRDGVGSSITIGFLQELGLTSCVERAGQYIRYWVPAIPRPAICGSLAQGRKPFISRCQSRNENVSRYKPRRGGISKM